MFLLPSLPNVLSTTTPLSPSPLRPSTSTWMLARSAPWRTNSPRCAARPSAEGRPARPRAMASTREDFPAPFGPRITLRDGPGRNEEDVYCMKSRTLTQRMEPGTRKPAEASPRTDGEGGEEDMADHCLLQIRQGDWPRWRTRRTPCRCRCRLPPTCRKCPECRRSLTRVANWSDSKNAMHKAKKCQKVPP